jgi:hypothetical protein
MPAAMAAAGPFALIRASWFETRGMAALLTMRGRDLILGSIAKAMRLEG